MYISYNWLHEFVDFDLPVGKLDSVLTMLGIEVENIIDYGEKYKNFYTARVLSCEKHPNADKLSICRVDYGSGENTVVCGASNVAAGQSVIIGLVGAIVPEGGFTLEKRKIRGTESSGMICSQYELGLGDDKSGIMVLTEDVTPGIPLAEYLGKDDIVLDISITPNRADCLSHLGIAREIAAYLRKGITKPIFEINVSSPDMANNTKVTVLDSDKCPRYTARIIRDSNITDSPAWLKNRLIKLGMRPVNNVVDITNLVLLELGQPLHAFDLDLIDGNEIIVKTAGNGEEFTSLDGKKRTLDSEMLMICDKTKSIAIGGVMGGGNSEITSATKNILLESAFFSPASVRRTSKKLGISSEASYRFERGIDIDNVAFASDRAAYLIAELTGGVIENRIIDIYPGKKPENIVNLRFKRVNDIIGIDLTKERIVELLSALGFHLSAIDENSVNVKVPAYRVDISLEIDLIEEIARLYNYDEIIPDHSSSINFGRSGIAKSLMKPDLRDRIRDFFILSGYNEILTQNQTDPDSAIIFDKDHITLANPLGEELSVMRPSMTPSMLKTIDRNTRLGNVNLRLFEIGKTFRKSLQNDTGFVQGISENEMLVVALSGSSEPKQWGITDRKVDFYDIKGIVSLLFESINIKNIEFKINIDVDIEFSSDSLKIYHEDIELGRLGEARNELLKTFGIESRVMLAVIDCTALYRLDTVIPYYSKVSPFPSIYRDIAFVTKTEINSGDMLLEIKSNGGNLLKTVEIFDVYSGKNLGDGMKSTAFSLKFSSPDRTLTDNEVDNSIKNIISVIEKAFNGSLRKF